MTGVSFFQELLVKGWSDERAKRDILSIESGPAFRLLCRGD